MNHRATAQHYSSDNYLNNSCCIISTDCSGLFSAIMSLKVYRITPLRKVPLYDRTTHRPILDVHYKMFKLQINIYNILVMHYGGDIPYFVPFRNALRSTTEVTKPLFCTSLRTGLIQILINLLKYLQVVL